MTLRLRNFFAFTILLIFADVLSANVIAEPIKLGVIAPLSGNAAEYGNAFRNGVELALDQKPECNSQLKLVYEDSKYDPKTAVSAFRKLVDTDKVDLIFNLGDSTSAALSPIAESNKVPLFVWSTSPLISKDKAFVVRFADSGKDFGTVLAEYLHSKSIFKIGIIKAENQYIQTMLEGLQASLKPGQTIEVLDSYQMSDQDFKSSISKIREKHFDAVGVFLISGQISQFYRQLAQQNLSLSTFGTDFFESLTEIKASGPAMEGAVFVSNSVSEEFKKNYTKYFNNDSQITFGGSGYDFANLICKKVSSIKSAVSSNGIISALTLREKAQDGALGKMNFVDSVDTGKSFHFPVAVKIVRSNEVVVAR